MDIFDHFALLLLSAALSYYFAGKYVCLSSYVTIFIHYLFHKCSIALAKPIATISADKTILGIDWTDFTRLNDLLASDKGRKMRKFLVQINSNVDVDSPDYCYPDALPRGALPTLILDLDETLIHSSVRLEEKSMNYDCMIYDDDRGVYTPVYKRPHVDAFLMLVSRYFEIVIFTASYACYCDPIVNSFPSHHVISRRLYNTSVTGHEKDLSLVTPSNMPCRTIMIDNSPEACVSHSDKLFLIRSYFAEKSDDCELVALCVFLVALSGIDDFRAVLQRRDRCGRSQTNSCHSQDD